MNKNVNIKGKLRLSPQSNITKSKSSKYFGIVNEAEVDVLLELSRFFDDPTDVGNLIS